MATTDPRTRPPVSTWYLATNLKAADAPLAEVVRLYGLRNWTRDHYKRVKDELGWADFMVRSDHGIRRHWTLVNCAFSFCWWHEAQHQPGPQETATPVSAKAAQTAPTANNARPKAREKNQPPAATGLLATGAAARARLVGALEVARHLLAGLEQQAPASRTRRTAQRPHRGPWAPAVSA